MVGDNIAKCKTIVAYFNRSTTAKKKLIKIQEEMGVQHPVLLIQVSYTIQSIIYNLQYSHECYIGVFTVKEVENRWNSLLFMLKRFSRLKDAVMAYSVQNDKDWHWQNNQPNWQLIQSVCNALEPVLLATNLVSTFFVNNAS